MKHRIPLKAVGHATSLFLAISFTICVIWDLLVPTYAMHESWHNLLPGFEWLSWQSFALGLAESYAYGWFIALIWVPLFTLFSPSTTDTTHTDNSCCGNNEKSKTI